MGVDASLFYMDLLELGIIMHRLDGMTGVTGRMSNGASFCQMSKN